MEGSVRREFHCWHDAYPGGSNVWESWLSLHGIDSTTVLINPGWIERDEINRRVRWLSAETDERGRFKAVRGADGVMGLDYIERYVQLEARPLPFPEV